MAQYRVIPFVASVGTQQGGESAAKQLEKLCNDHGQEGWEFLGLESVETHVAGSSGCFGFGATPAVLTSFTMAVFVKK